MTSYERVAAALSHKEADRVPVYPIMCGINRKLVGAGYEKWSTDAETCAAGFLKTAELFDIDCLVTLIDLSIECDAWGQKLIYPENEAAHPDYSVPVIREVEDYASIKKVDYRNSKRMMMHIDVCRRLVEAKKGELPVVAFVFGPLVSHLRKKGVKKILVDSDGNSVQLTDKLVEAGADGHYPLEINSGSFPEEIRKRHPKLALIGGINKLVLAQDRAAIDKELSKLPPLLEQGGYIPALDHRVQPDVPMANYQYYIDRKREIMEKYCY